MSNNFYFRGNLYQTFEEFLNASIKFNKEKVDVKSFKELWDNLGRDVALNMEIKEIKLNNNQLQDVLCETLCFIIENIERKRMIL